MDSFLQKEDYIHKDIEQLLHNSADESLYLEFKSAEALIDQPKTKTEISKDVSSFANSDGGIIIYGIKEDKDKRASEITYVDTRKFSKEWLEQVIDSNIQRRISGIRIYLIPNPKQKDQGIYIVKIPTSPQVPHMAGDKRFYKRQNFTTTQMEEYEVRMFYNQKGRTELDIYRIEGPVNGHFQSGSGTHSINFNLEILITNVSSSIEEHYKLEFCFPSRMLTPVVQHPEVQTYIHRHEKDYVIYSIPGKAPIFQDDILPMARIMLQVNSMNYDSFKEGELRVKLYYSNGVKEITHKLYELFPFKGKPIERESIKQ